MTVTAPPQADTIGDLFRVRRRELGLTLEQVAHRSELAVSTVIRVENGQREPRRGTVVRIANVLGITDDALEAVVS